jgi:hypothetical protein
MADEIIKELWKIKDDMAKEYGGDVKAFVSKLRARNQEVYPPAIDLRHTRGTTEQDDQTRP